MSNYRTEGPAAWAPILGLSLAAFVFNTSEFLPVGLLPDIAESLRESIPTTGLILTGYAFVVAVMSLPLTILTARMERRRLLLALLAFFSLCHFVMPWVSSFGSVMAARVGVALAHSIFWAVITPLAVRVAPRGRGALALSCVMGGTIVATVLGVPIGTHLGQILGWQEAFFVNGVASALVFAVIWRVLPVCESRRAGSLASVPVIFRRPALVQIYLITVLAVLGQFTVYSYIAPIVHQVGGLSESDIVTVLFVFGIAGIAGVAGASRTVDAHRTATCVTAMALLALSMLSLPFVATSAPALWAVALIWGAGMTAMCLSFQTTVLAAAPDCADVAASLHSGIFNIGIGGGAYLGGWVVEHMGYDCVNLVGFAMVAAAIAVIVWARLTTGRGLIPYSPEKDNTATSHD